MVQGGLGPQPAAVAEGKGEAPRALGAALGEQGSQMSPVGLGLLAGRGLETAHGYRPRGGPLGLQPLFEQGVAAAVALLTDFAQQHLGIPDAGRQPLVQIRLEGVEFAGRRVAGPVSGRLGMTQILANSLAVVAAEFADGLNAQALLPPFE